jgi:hypothetical protein
MPASCRKLRLTLACHPKCTRIEANGKKGGSVLIRGKGARSGIERGGEEGERTSLLVVRGGGKKQATESEEEEGEKGQLRSEGRKFDWRMHSAGRGIKGTERTLGIQQGENYHTEGLLRGRSRRREERSVEEWWRSCREPVVLARASYEFVLTFGRDPLTCESFQTPQQRQWKSSKRGKKRGSEANPCGSGRRKRERSPCLRPRHSGGLD